MINVAKGGVLGCNKETPIEVLQKNISKIF